MPRVFLAQGLTTNGVAVGGMASIAFDAGYRDVVKSSPDGAAGEEEVDRAGLSVGVNLDCSDVTKSNAILDGAVGNTIFSGKEAGAATYQKVTVPGVVYGGMNLNIPQNADATLNLTGKVRFPDGNTDLDGLIACVGAQSAPALTHPTRLYRAFGAQFNPGVAISPTHLVSISLSLSADILEEYGDDDIGMTGVERLGFGALQVTLVHKDASVVAGSNRAAELIKASYGTLTATLKGRGGAKAYDAAGNAQGDPLEVTTAMVSGREPPPGARVCVCVARRRERPSDLYL